MNIHVVCDLETFGTRDNAMIFAIGLTCNDGHSYYAELPTCGQGRAVDMKTIEWWEKQSGPGREIFNRAWKDYGTPKSQVDRKQDWDFCKQVLIEVCGYIHEKKNKAIMEECDFFFWGNSPEFDQRKLRNMMEEYGVSPTWHEKEESCVRTIRRLNGYASLKTPHHALEDAKMEMELLRKCITMGGTE